MGIGEGMCQTKDGVGLPFLILFYGGENPKVRSPTELIMDLFEEGGVLRVRVV